MGSHCTVCLLTQGRRSAPDLLLSSVILHPGQAFSFSANENVLLASGFSSLTPDTAFPLSPTLQLNLDLAGASEDQLQRLALAELARHRALHLSTYLVHPDPRIWVIGNSPDKLHHYRDTYDGLLEVYPLLTDGHDPELPRVSELQISRDPKGLYLVYTVVDPIDQTRCSYCGACGHGCPQNCIDHRLRIDLTNCSRCGYCEAACPEQAINFSGREISIPSVPAILLLDDATTALPADRRDIYSEREFASFLAGQSVLEVEEAIAWRPELCQHDQDRAAGCRLCLDSCGHGALSCTPSGIVIDHRRCRECGSCVSVCQTGAMQYLRWPDQAFANYLEAIQPLQATTVVLGSERLLREVWWRRPEIGSGTAFLEWPQPAALSIFHLLRLLLAGPKRIVILTEPENVRPAEPLAGQIKLVNTLFRSCFKSPDVVVMASKDGLAAAVGGQQVGQWPLFDGELAGSRRRQVRDMLHVVINSAEKENVFTTEPAAGFASLGCDGARCTVCLGCLGSCRTGALTADAAGSSLLWHGGLCVGCGCCQAVCPEQALVVTDGAVLGEEFFAPQVLATAQPMSCECCGQPFGNRKIYERVRALLAARNIHGADHLTLCEECRPVRILEAV